MFFKETHRYLQQYLEDNKEYLDEQLARHPITVDDNIDWNGDIPQYGNYVMYNLSLTFKQELLALPE